MKAFLPLWMSLAALNSHYHYVVAEEVLNYQPEILESTDGLLEVTFQVGMVTSLNGDRIAAGYNGKPVGPTLRLNAGDTLRLTLENNLEPNTDVDVELFEYIMTSYNDANVSIIANHLGDYGTPYSSPYGYWGANYQNIHFHGAGLSPDLEDPTMWLDGGESKTYEFVIPNENWSRFPWYHDHVHGLAGHAMLSGLCGFIEIIGSDDHIKTIPEIAEATEIFLMLGESSQIPDTTSPAFLLSVVFDFSWRHITNGHYGDETVFTFKKGETALFRAANAGTEPPMPLSIDDHMLLPIAYDGFPVLELNPTEIVTIHAGSRAEFMVKFDTPGNYTFRRNPFNFGITGDACNLFFPETPPFVPEGKCISFDRTEVVATIIVEDEQGSKGDQDLPTTVPETSSYLKEREVMPTVGNPRRVEFMLNDGPAAYPVFQVPCLEDVNGTCVHLEPAFAAGINNRLFNPRYIEGTIMAGTCETWEIFSNFPVAGHSFHMHSVPFWILQMDGVALDPPIWRDTAPVYNNMTVHVCFPEDHVGLINVHCHMPGHQDTGMGIYYEVVDGWDDFPDCETGPPTDSPTIDSASYVSYSFAAAAMLFFLSFLW